MATALEMMISAAMKNLPEGTLNTIAQIGQTVQTFQAQLNRIEAQNTAIIRHFEIVETDNAEQRKFISGQTSAE